MCGKHVNSGIIKQEYNQDRHMYKIFEKQIRSTLCCRQVRALLYKLML